jgi:hypothetical protein
VLLRSSRANLISARFRVAFDNEFVVDSADGATVAFVAALNNGQVVKQTHGSE